MAMTQEVLYGELDLALSWSERELQLGCPYDGVVTSPPDLSLNL